MSTKDERVTNTDSVNSFVSSLEDRLASRSDQLEEVHLEAAIFAQVAEADDGINLNSVGNCFSPYVPSRAENIAAFISFAELTTDDVVLDIGCGDGRVCVAAAASKGCRSIGVDVSPPCIQMSKQVAQEEGLLDPSRCTFYEADMTADPNDLLNERTPLANDLLSVTVVYLYTYPTLLVRLAPLLIRLFVKGNLHAVITLTYHLQDVDRVTVKKVDKEYDLRLYTRIEGAQIKEDRKQAS